MTGSRVLLELVVVLGTAAVTTFLFQMLRLPVVIGYIVAGLLIGPHVPTPLVANVELIQTLSQLGVILLLFALGLELRLTTLARVGIGAGLTALFEVTLVLTAGALVAGLIGYSTGEAVFAGSCVAISSTMVVAKSFETLGWKSGFTEVVFAILVFDDLLAILLLTVLAGFASGAGLAPGELAVTIGKLAAFLATTLVVGLLVVPRFVRLISTMGRNDTLLIVSLGICFGIAALTEQFGYPVALGAFVAGLLVAESGHGRHILDLVRPIRDVFAMMFFVSIGMTIEPAQLATEWSTIVLFAAVVFIMKPIGVGLGTFAAGRGLQPAIRSGISLAQIGELSLVIASIGVTSGIARPSLLAIAVGVTCATTLTSSVMIRHSEAIARELASRVPARLATFASFYEQWLGRLRGRERAVWPRVRRPAVVLALDAAVIVAIVIGGAIADETLRAEVGLTGSAAEAAVVAIVLSLTAPFGLSLVRRVIQIARILALVAIPGARKQELAPPASIISIDLGRAPRRALTLMFELALATVIAVPMIAAVRPFIGNAGIWVGAIVIVLITITYRSIMDFDKHVRAGSALILELLQHPPADATQQPLAQIDTVLPGFGGLISITVAPSSPAVGKSLADLDLRARTGATVLAIGRGEGGFATPTPTEPIRAGDLLALTGSDDALAAARTALTEPQPA